MLRLILKIQEFNGGICFLKFLDSYLVIEVFITNFSFRLTSMMFDYFWLTTHIMHNNNARNSGIIFCDLYCVINYSIFTENKYNVYQYNVGQSVYGEQIKDYFKI